jgi:6-phosphogluconolactonase
MVDVVVVPNAEALAREAARRFALRATEAIETRGRFSVVLSGGSTPGGLYRLLAGQPYRDQIPWQTVHLFWGDERCVPPQDPGSNYLLAEEALIAHVPIPPENVHRIRGELEPQQAAAAYDRQLRAFFVEGTGRARDRKPEIQNPKSFDMVLLGLGRDGHTASLFPGSPALDERERLAVAVEAHYEDRPSQRVTLTLPAINSARRILFLVAGSAKAEIVRAVLATPKGILPAQQVRPSAGQVAWLLDAAASKNLD